MQDTETTVPRPQQTQAQSIKLHLAHKEKKDDQTQAVLTEGPAQFFEYTTAADPLAAGLLPRVPPRKFAASLYRDGPTRVIPLDLAHELACEGPATAPGLLASFVRIVAGEKIDLQPNATSQLFYVIRGAGHVKQGDHQFDFEQGAFFTLPGGAPASVRAAKSDGEEATALYCITDEPLLRYLGAKVEKPRFEPTLYTASATRKALETVTQAPDAKSRNRVSVLLAHENFPQTRTVTHVVWAMKGIIDPHAVQKPHRHQSVALDLIADCPPKGCYTLLGHDVDDNGDIIDPQRIDWEPGMVFVTPPGMWHGHYNDSDEPGYVIPIQDAGLHTYLRSLDIRFTK